MYVLSILPGLSLGNNGNGNLSGVCTYILRNSQKMAGRKASVMVGGNADLRKGLWCVVLMVDGRVPPYLPFVPKDAI
jgi:hypothetical protein